MKTLFLAVLIFTTFSGVAQIGAKAQQPKINGVWHNNSFGYQMTLILNENGRGEFDGDEISFVTQNNKLSIVAQGVTTTYSYLLQGNALTLTGGDLDAPITFNRSGTDSKAETQPAINTKSTTSAGSIIGKWSGNGETIEFNPNGQCLYMGQTYPYQAEAGHVTLQTAQGNFMMAYSITGNQLSLTVNGQTLNYTKGEAGGDSPASTGGGGGEKRIAQELVGKWCYVNVNSTYSGGSSTEQCITLNADGTYLYYGETSRNVNTNTYSGGTNSQSSDRGTWSYDGARIYYTSSQGKGTGSYLLEKRNHPKNNDPMIVLDGTTYVTHYQKAPWR